MDFKKVRNWQVQAYRYYLELLAKFIELRQNGTAGGRVAAFLTECSQNNIDLSPWEKRINALKLKVCST